MKIKELRRLYWKMVGEVKDLKDQIIRMEHELKNRDIGSNVKEVVEEVEDVVKYEKK